VFASHHWPTWDKDRIVEFLSLQRDMYADLQDQTLRLLNEGYTGIEIAETFQMPPALKKAWHTHGYYGSVSHNVKGSTRPFGAPDASDKVLSVTFREKGVHVAYVHRHKGDCRRSRHSTSVP
jgi:alkyl sulfatase BDS1-like metallo-beta-lactamase superfamily hydrolase